MLRLHPRGWGEGWFIEGGSGVNAVFPTYGAGRKMFSPPFDFGDHLAVGKRFGRRLQHEWTLRFQHFSNGRIEKPSPGENFLQVRYTRRL